MEVILKEKISFANGIVKTISLNKIDTGFVTIVETVGDGMVFKPSMHFDQYLDDANVYYISEKNTALRVAKSVEEYLKK